MLSSLRITVSTAFLLAASAVAAAPVYLNQANITVSVGAGTSPGTFNNTFDGASTILKVIDAPSAAAEEFHDQTTHIWFTANSPGGGLELLFDFFQPYDVTTLHFWNYTDESYDVDNIDFTFFDGGNVQVGSLSVQPALGTSPGIAAQDIALAAPLSIRYIKAFLTGSNQQVDFQNMGFTAELSEVPAPGALVLLATGLAALLLRARRRLQ